MRLLAADRRRERQALLLTALERLAAQLATIFAVGADAPVARELARFAMAAFDGAFVAYQASPDTRLRQTLAYLPEALVAIARRARVD